MTYKYNRISTSGQKLNRQIQKGIMNYSDVCSGIVPFMEREQASALLAIVKFGDTIEIESIDRLGRDKMEMLNTLNMFKKLAINIRIKNLGIESFPTEGNYSSVFEIVTTLLSVLSAHELLTIRERTKQGIEIAKIQGKYKGRKKGSVLPRELFLERNKKEIQIIKKHPTLSLRDLAKLTQISHVKVKKIKAML